MNDLSHTSGRNTDAGRAPARFVEGVDRGQLWSASDDDGNALFVLVLGAGDGGRVVTVMPLMNGDRVETGDAIVIEAGSPFTTPMVVWPALKAVIPVRLLNSLWGVLDAKTVDAIEHDDPSPASLQDSLRRGTEPEDELSPVLDERDNLGLTLIAWHGMCAKLPQLHDGDESDEYATDDALTAYATGLRKVLGLSMPEALAVMRGTSALNDRQRKTMADAGFSDAPRKEIIIPDDYLIRAESPRWRSVADLLKERNPRIDSRYELAREAFTLSARTTGHGDQAVDGALAQAASAVTAASLASGTSAAPASRNR